MANQTNSLSHTKWMCKYHIVFIPKYRRKAIYGQYRADLQEIIRTLCKYKGVEILEGHMMPDHVHLLLSIKHSVSSFMGHLKGKWSLRNPSHNGTEDDECERMKIADFVIDLEQAKKYQYSFSTKKRVYNWVDLNVSV